MAFILYISINDILLTLRNKKYPLAEVEWEDVGDNYSGAVKVQGLIWNKINLFSFFRAAPSGTQRNPALCYSALAASASLLLAAQHFAGFASAKPWPAKGRDLLVELQLKAEEGGEPGSACAYGYSDKSCSCRRTNWNIVSPI